jgi:hypothetical protein
MCSPYLCCEQLARFVELTTTATRATKDLPEAGSGNTIDNRWMEMNTMEFSSFDLVNSLHVLPETTPVEVDGIQFNSTCSQQCVSLSVNVIQTVCAVSATCC